MKNASGRVLLAFLVVTSPLLIQCSKDTKTKPNPEAKNQSDVDQGKKSEKPSDKTPEKAVPLAIATPTPAGTSPVALAAASAAPPKLSQPSGGSPQETNSGGNPDVNNDSEKSLFEKAKVKVKEQMEALSAAQTSIQTSVQSIKTEPYRKQTSQADQLLASLAADRGFDPVKLEASGFSREQIAQLHELIKERTTKEMSATLLKINEMRADLRGLVGMQETDMWVKWLRRTQFVCVGLNTLALAAHSKNPEINAAMSATSVLAALTNSILRHYDPMTHEWIWYSPKTGGHASLTSIVEESLRKVEPLAESDPELKKAVQSLQEALAFVKDNQSKVSAAVDQIGGVQDTALLLSAYDLFSHFMPKVFRYSAGTGLKSILQGFVPAAAAIENNAKRGASISSGASSIPDVLNLTFGMSSDQVQNMMRRIEENLAQASVRLEAAIQERKK